MDKLKILHIYKSFNVYNGLIEILTIMAQNIDHDHYELGVCVYEYSENSFGERFKKLGGKIFNLDIPQKIYNEPRGVLALYSFFKQYKPHVVQTHVLKANLYGTFAAKMAGVPVVIATEMTLKDIAPSKLRRFRDRLVQPLAGLVIDNCDKFVVTSKYIKKEWVKSSNENHFEVIYPPFNLEKYDEAVRVPRSNVTSLGKRIGYVGRLSEEKNIPVLLEAMVEITATIPEAELTIVGTGPMEMELKEICIEKGIETNIHFAGYKENSFEALKELDIFVLPSRTEGCPIVILEAMAMGLPVVATKVGGNPELVVDGETGILVSHSNSHQIAVALKSLMENREKARQMGQNGRKLAFSQYHPSSFTSRLQMLYKQLYEKKQSDYIQKPIGSIHETSSCHR